MHCGNDRGVLAWLSSVVRFDQPCNTDCVTWCAVTELNNTLSTTFLTTLFVARVLYMSLLFQVCMRVYKAIPNTDTDSAVPPRDNCMHAVAAVVFELDKHRRLAVL